MAGLRVVRRTVVTGSVLLLVAGFLVFLGVPRASASSATYYVDNTASCPGLGTQASPWCNFSVIDSRNFGPGDEILLRWRHLHIGNDTVWLRHVDELPDPRCVRLGSGADHQRREQPQLHWDRPLQQQLYPGREHFRRRRRNRRTDQRQRIRLDIGF